MVCTMENLERHKKQNIDQLFQIPCVCCVCVCPIHMCIETSVFLNHSSPYYSKQNLSLNLEPASGTSPTPLASEPQGPPVADRPLMTGTRGPALVLCVRITLRPSHHCGISEYSPQFLGFHSEISFTLI